MLPSNRSLLKTYFYLAGEFVHFAIESFEEYHEFMNEVIGDDPTPFVNHNTHGDWNKLAESPCKYGKIVVYTGAQYHSPTISNHSKTRWSHLISEHPWK